MTIQASDKATELYSDLCDVIERAWCHEPVERHPDDFYVTSTYARAGAMRIMDLIEETYGIDPWSADKE